MTHSDNEDKELEGHKGERRVQYPRIFIDPSGKIVENSKPYTQIADKSDSDRLAKSTSNNI